MTKFYIFLNKGTVYKVLKYTNDRDRRTHLTIEMLTHLKRTGNVKPCNNNLIFTQEKLRVGECILIMHQLWSLLIGIPDLKTFAQGE